MKTSVGICVTIGQFSNKESLIAALDRSEKCSLLRFARYMLTNDTHPSPHAEEVYEVICCSAGQLLNQQGLVKISALKHVVKALNGLCPPQLAAYYCLQADYVGEGKELYFVMEQISNSNDDPCIFRIVGNDGRNVLNGFSAFNNSTTLDSNTQIVYVRRLH